MKVAFVGVGRHRSTIPEGYLSDFVRYHLELPHYYASDSVKVDVTIPGASLQDTVDSGVPRVIPEEYFGSGYDVIVHWRKWFPQFYRPDAVNVINCQDHSFGLSWKEDVHRAFSLGQLHGIMCFPGWHEANIHREMGLPFIRTIPGLTLGVDVDTYQPHPMKSPYELLWASDPGRGLGQMLFILNALRSFDKRFTLNVCYPDYVDPKTVQGLTGPGIVVHGALPNGPDLWNLFGRCGILPYASTFMEPSSRAHRQAMSCASLVLYPEKMGTPSELIVDGVTGFVRHPRSWPATIIKSVSDGSWAEIGRRAREYAVSESWAVQAARFKSYFEKVIRGQAC